MTNLRRDVPSDLATLFASGQILMVADLYTITLDGGGVKQWTNADVPVKIGTTTWSIGPGISRRSIKWQSGVTVDQLDITINGDSTTQINGVPIIPFIAGGGLDQAWVVLDRAYAPVGGAWVNKLNLFTGRVSQANVERLKADVTVASILELMNVNLPRNIYQAPCANTVYDNACQASRAAFVASGEATSTTDSGLLTFSTSLTQPDHYFDLGAITFTGGSNNGLSYTVASFVAGVITLMQAAIEPVAIGDTVTIVPGCDGTMGTCQSRFSNIIHFRGQPAIPVPTTVL